MAWLSRESAAAAAVYECYMPVESPPEAITIETELEISEVSLGCIEVAWRILAEGVVVVPPALACFVAQHMLRGPGKEIYAEGEELKERLLAYCARAKLLIIPVYAAAHWTLLALQRVNAKPTTVETDATAKGKEAGFGCHSCKYTSCAACSSDQFINKFNRQLEELKIIDPINNGKNCLPARNRK